MAKTSLVAYTWTETMQTLEPIGIDRWPYELALKYGIRDAPPVGSASDGSWPTGPAKS